MKILVLASEIPATPSMPGSPRLFSLCRYLSKHHRLTLLAFGHGSERHEAFLGDPMTQGVFQDVIVLPEAPKAGWWGRQVHRIRQEANIVTRYRTPKFFAEQTHTIRAFVASGRFEVVYVDGLPAAQYLMDREIGCPAIIDLHDCFTLLFRRTMQAETHWLRKAALFREAKSIERLERALSRVFTKIVTNSEVDESFLRALDPRADTLTIGNGVDWEYFDGAELPRDRSKVVFTGVMNYVPNEAAAIHFAEVILPLIHKRHPEVELWLVGKDPTARVRSLAERPGVRVTGGVPDVRPYLQSAGVFVCPLLFGAGVKNKLLAALSMNAPAVVTPLSIEGLDLQDGHHLLVADNPADFAESVIRLIENRELATRLGRNGKEAVRRKYSWEGSGRLIEDTLRSVALR